jgi:hypothetical protein
MSFIADIGGLISSQIPDSTGSAIFSGIFNTITLPAQLGSSVFTSLLGGGSGMLGGLFGSGSSTSSSGFSLGTYELIGLALMGGLLVFKLVK